MNRNQDELQHAFAGFPTMRNPILQAQTGHPFAPVVSINHTHSVVQ